MSSTEATKIPLAMIVWPLADGTLNFKAMAMPHMVHGSRGTDLRTATGAALTTIRDSIKRWYTTEQPDPFTLDMYILQHIEENDFMTLLPAYTLTEIAVVRSKKEKEAVSQRIQDEQDQWWETEHSLRFQGPTTSSS